MQVELRALTSASPSGSFASLRLATMCAWKLRAFSALSVIHRLSQIDLSLFIQSAPALLLLPLLSGFLFIVHVFLVVELGALPYPMAIPVGTNGAAIPQPLAILIIAPKQWLFFHAVSFTGVCCWIVASAWDFNAKMNPVVPASSTTAAA